VKNELVYSFSLEKFAKEENSHFNLFRSLKRL